MGIIKRQSIYGTILSYIGVLIAFVNVYLQPHLIETEDIGLLRLLLSFSFLIGSLMPLGLGNVILRYFPHIRDPESGHNGFFTLIVLIVFIGGLVTGSVLLLGKGFFVDYYENSPGIIEYYVPAILTGMAIAMNTVLTVYTFSLFKTIFPSFLNDVFIRIGQLALILLFHYDQIDLNGFVIGNLGLFGLQLVLLMIYLKVLKAIPFRINWRFYKTLDRKSILFYAFFMTFSGLTSLSIKYMDQMMIGHFMDEYEIGIYSTCILICVVIEVPLRSLERVAQPQLAAAWADGNRTEIHSIYEKSSRYMFYIGAVIFCLLWANIDIIFMLLPPEFESGRDSFLIISVSSLINLLTGVNTSIIALSKRYYVVSFALLLLMITLIVLNNFLIPSMGTSGAALSVLIGYSCYNFLMYLYNLLAFRMQPFSKYTILISAGLLVFIAVWLWMPESWNPFLRAALQNVVVGVVFLFLNIRFGIIHEVNKVLIRIGVLKG